MTYDSTMSKKTPPPEDALFREAMKNVKPLKNTPHITQIKSKMSDEQIKQKQDRANRFKHEQPHLNYSEGFSAYKPIHGDDVMQFQRSTLPAKWLKQLKRGQIEIEATLDLHTYTASAAAEQLKQFMTECLRRKIFCIHIIHGKGQMGDIEKPTLKNFVNDYLRQQKNVLAFHSSQPKHGGTGATYVILERLNE